MNLVDPRVNLSSLQTAKELAKCQSPNGVENGHEVVIDHLDRTARIGNLSEHLNQKVSVLYSGGLLVAKSFVAKCVVKQASETGMVLSICYQNTHYSIRCKRKTN